VHEGRALVTVDVELADDPSLLADEDHELGAGGEGAGQVIVELAYVLDELVLLLGHCGAADPVAYLICGLNSSSR
jgi:hypothetical protein